MCNRPLLFTKLQNSTECHISSSHSYTARLPGCESYTALFSIPVSIKLQTGCWLQH